MGLVLLVVALVSVNGVAIAKFMRRRARSLLTVDGGGSNGALSPPRAQMTRLVVALRRLAVRVVLVLACGLGAASVVFVVWAVPHASNELPAQALALSSGVFPLF